MRGSKGAYLNKEACSSAVNRMVRRSLAPDHTSRQRCRIPEGGNPGFGLVDHEMVAGGLQPSEFVSPAIQIRTDSSRSLDASRVLEALQSSVAELSQYQAQNDPGTL